MYLYKAMVDVVPKYANQRWKLKNSSTRKVKFSFIVMWPMNWGEIWREKNPFGCGYHFKSIILFLEIATFSKTFSGMIFISWIEAIPTLGREMNGVRKVILSLFQFKIVIHNCAEWSTLQNNKDDKIRRKKDLVHFLV